MAEELKIMQKVFDMMQYGYGALAQYPKSEKFALCTDIKRCMDSQKTVALQMQRPSRDYIVITEASNVKGNLGQIEVSDQLSNGFKVAYTGSATAATINYIVIGGYMK